MTLRYVLHQNGLKMSEAEKERFIRHFDGLEARLRHFPEPIVEASVTEHPAQRRVELNLRVSLGPLGGHLVSHQSAETLDKATRLAVSDVERQLERRLAKQRGEPTFGQPSRREPRSLRPHPPGRRDEAEELEEEEKG
ncbi:MAG: HPF/RaiA family ribosome-associated protein [Chloroflexota bacterium]|nr:HPF/RaiA family ribosome-associated protein [Dehalococcoidia bacterium]MDW8252501.1 HPF/RaiA family ribosome-associated protein [Chloroflexota bacterium]